MAFKGQSAAREPEAEAVLFAEGLPGWADAREWELVRHPEADPFIWIRAREREGVVLLLLDPRAIEPDYDPELPTELRRRLELRDGESVLTLCVVNLGRESEDATVNLRAPIVVNPRAMRGAQVILEGSNLPLARPLLSSEDVKAG